MKRDWDLLRKQLTNIEEGNDVLAEIPHEPKWTDDLTQQGYEHVVKEYKELEERIAGHLELIIDSGYVEGVTVSRGADNFISFGIHAPRLTMAGHDLLDTMRSATVWEKVKSTARKKGIELTFDAIKSLAGVVIKQMLAG
jgi:Hypothetical protein (DUF2513)